MKGHVRKRGSKWVFVIDVGRDEKTGKRIRKWFSGFNTKKEAEKAMAEKINEVNLGNYVEPSKEKISTFMATWLENKKINIRPSTFRTYEWLVNKHIIPGIGNYELLKLRPIHLQKFYNELKKNGQISDQVINKIHKIIKAALNQAETWGMINKNVANLVDAPRFDKVEIHTWTHEEVKKFLDVAKVDRLFIAFFLAITTGMRRGEILGLRWKDIDFDKKVLSIKQTLSNTGDTFQETKTASSRRTIALSDITVEELKKHKRMITQEKLIAGPVYKDNDLVVCTTLGTKMLPRNLARTWYRLLKQANVPKIRFHDLRHTHASLMLEQGIHAKIVQERLGHANIKVTLDTYSHVLPGIQEEAAKQFEEGLFGSKNNLKKSL